MIDALAAACAWPAGTVRLRTILAAPQPPAPLVLTDLDGTLLEPAPMPWPDGISRRVRPEAVAALRSLRRDDVRVGVVTERPWSAYHPWLAEITALVLGPGVDPYTLFNGPVIGEGGATVRRCATGKRPGTIVRLGSRRADAARQAALDWLTGAIVDDGDGWGRLAELDRRASARVALPPPGEQGDVAIFLYEEGPNVADDPAAAQHYGAVAAWVAAALRERGVGGLALLEAGNGTLRIAPRGIGKERTVRLLARFGALDPTRTIFVGDGANDVALAAWLHEAGGASVAVANAVPALRTAATCAMDRPGGLGFADAVLGWSNPASLVEAPAGGDHARPEVRWLDPAR